MDWKFVTKNGKVYHDPADEAINNSAFGIMWNNNPHERDRIISCFKWRIDDDHFGHLLVDPLGEARGVSWGDYHPAIEFPSWAEFDNAKNAESLKRLRDEREKLLNKYRELEESLQNSITRRESVLRDIFDITVDGGPHSRRKVKDIIWQEIDICQECGRARCCCE